MYQIWSKQYATFLKEYQSLLTALQTEPHEPQTQRLALHFQKLFNHLDLSLLTEAQQQEWSWVVVRTSQHLGLVEPAVLPPTPDPESVAEQLIPQDNE